MQARTRKLITIAILAAIAYVVMVFGRVPVVLFLRYDPKDVIITIGGFLYGPMAAFAMSVIVSFIEMFTVSDTGPIGLAMNIVSTSAFACTAAFIYSKHRNIIGAIIGLAIGWLLATGVMMLWNYFITPIYMGFPRQAVAELLIPAFLPFNLIKGGLNAAITMLLYKPLSNTLRRAGLLPEHETGPTELDNPKKVLIGYIPVSLFVIITCILLILVLQGII